MKKTILTVFLALSLLLTACAPSLPTSSDVGTTAGASPVLSFSVESGIYAKPFTLSITAPSDAQIFYTTDGSDPTADGALPYTAPIAITDRKNDKNVVSAVDPVLFSANYNRPNRYGNNFDCTVSAPSDDAVDKCTVVRAACTLADGTVLEKSAVYFIGTTDEHIPGLAGSCDASGQSLAVLSISMNYDDLFDPERGIYVKGERFDKALRAYLYGGKRVTDGETARSLDANYKQRGREWEREASVTLFEFSQSGAQAVLTQRCGIRIQGNYSRSDLQKSFRLYARKDYGQKNFNYAVFGDDYRSDDGSVMDKFHTLVLRAGGNCAFTSKFNDTFWQSMLWDSACETQRSRPCVVYLNGEYWGLYVLQEDYSDDYFEDLHGVEKDDVVVYKGDAETYSIGYKLDEGELPGGAGTDYYFRDLLDFFDTHADLKNEAAYRQFCTLVDPDSVRDYFAVQCWINNKWDWPGKNWSMWRTIRTDADNPYADGRWRFQFYDMDFGGVSGASDAPTNTIREDNYKPNGLLDRNTNNPAVLCFVYLMTNENFRQSFYDRLNELTAQTFSPDSARSVLNTFRDTYAPLYDQFFARYPGSGSRSNAVSGGYASIRCLRDFLAKRPDYIQNMIDYCEKVLT